MAGISQFPNDLKEHKLVKAATFPRDSKSEDDRAVKNVIVKSDLLGKIISPDTVLCREASGSERFCRTLSLQAITDIEHNDSYEELEQASEEDYWCPDSDENKIIISCRLNKEAEPEDKIDQLTEKLRSCVMKTIVDLESRPDATTHRNIRKRKNSNYESGETGVLQNETVNGVEKALKLKITVTVDHRSSISSNSSSCHSSCEGRKSPIWDSTDSTFESRSSDASKEIETLQNDIGQSKLPLPPRLKEATYRNPLGLSSSRRDPTELLAPGSFRRLFSAKESSGRKSVQSALCKAVNKQKDISVKLWRGSVHFIRELENLEFPSHIWKHEEHENNKTLMSGSTG